VRQYGSYPDCRATHCRQRFHPLAPGADRWVLRVHALRLRREAEGVDDRQHVEIGEAWLRAQQKWPAIRQLALQHLEANVDLRHRMRHDLLVRWDAELREHVALMRDVVDQVGVVVAVDRADPLVHAAPLLRIAGRQLRPVERVVDIADNRGRLVDEEIAMLQDRNPLERVQRDMARRVHLRFEVVEGVRDILVGQDDTGHLHENAARKAEQGDVRHWVLQAAASLGFAERDIPPQAFGPASGRSAVLGRMPWESRATAFEPDSADMGWSNSRINRAEKKHLRGIWPAQETSVIGPGRAG
jgi:hypothetical protein